MLPWPPLCRLSLRLALLGRTRTPTGPPASISAGKVSLTLHSQALQLLFNETTSVGSASVAEAVRFVIGSVDQQPTSGSLCLRLDRYDPGRSLGSVTVPTVSIPGDVPLRVHLGADHGSDGVLTPSEASSSCDRIHEALCGGAGVQLSRMVSLIGGCTVTDGTLTLNVDAVLPSLSIRAVPIAPLAVASTPASLVASLGEPVTLPETLGNVSYAPESGFLTLDADRKAVSALSMDTLVSRALVNGEHPLRHIRKR